MGEVDTPKKYNDEGRKEKGGKEGKEWEESGRNRVNIRGYKRAD